MELLNEHQEEVEAACINFKVDELYAFGSILGEQFNSESDIDFIVSIFTDDPIEYAEYYFDLKFELQKIFNREIDLLEEKAIRNRTFEYLINPQKKLIYARRDKSLA